MQGLYWQVRAAAPYLTHVHDISLDHLEHDTLLRDHIRALPGRRIVYTNGSAPYAERVLAARGLDGLFDAIYGVEHAGFRPKPERGAFEAIFAHPSFPSFPPFVGPAGPRGVGGT